MSFERERRKELLPDGLVAMTVMGHWPTSAAWAGSQLHSDKQTLVDAVGESALPLPDIRSDRRVPVGAAGTLVLPPGQGSQRKFVLSPRLRAL